jgi:hypothetical protein
MGVKVQLPPGCSGIDAKDGTKYTASRPGGQIEVDDRHASAINSGQYGDTGLVSAKGALSFGTKEGKQCPDCGRLWNVWNSSCPKCGVETFTV